MAWVLAIPIFTLLATAALAEAPPTLPPVDRIRLAEAFRLADSLGNRLWPGWDQAPFAVLLVTPEREFLLRHPEPTLDFTAVGDDSLLGSRVWYRPRQFSPQLLATFPAVGGVPTIVIGQAESTQARSSTPWVTTLLHEHFHQLQYSRPGYYQGVNALGLARGDSTSMWMLNYPFPYANADVGRAFARLTGALRSALEAKKPEDFSTRLETYLTAKQALRAALSADDYKYLSFQLWQEGIARYTQYRIAALASERYVPSPAFRELGDGSSYGVQAALTMDGIAEELRMPLARSQRVAFYAVGAGEGLLLDRAHPGWRGHYFELPFSLDEAFAR